jgi:short-subunit dehydrogenase
MAGAVVIGAGPGIGQAVARRFAREGLPVTLVARGRQTVDTAADALAPYGVPVLSLTADSTDETALRGPRRGRAQVRHSGCGRVQRRGRPA